MLRELLGVFVSLCWLSASALAAGPTYTDPGQTDDDFPFQGEYVGMIGDVKIGLQVIALGKGKFHAVAYHGGLPGAGWQKDLGKHEGDGELKEGTVTIVGKESDAKIKDGGGTILQKEGKELGKLQRVTPTRPTLAPMSPMLPMLPVLCACATSPRSSSPWHSTRLRPSDLAR